MKTIAEKRRLRCDVRFLAQRLIITANRALSSGFIRLETKPHWLCHKTADFGSLFWTCRAQRTFRNDVRNL
jgi:hypothetical protein